jgi:hypothetical protein
LLTRRLEISITLKIPAPNPGRFKSPSVLLTYVLP